MSRPVQPPDKEEDGVETHPAFALISANRVSHGGMDGGSVLFDSDLRHPDTIVIQIDTATRRRDLARDWLHPGKRLIEVELSQAQWASFITTMNHGTGSPATLRWTRQDGLIPGVPYQPRMAESLAEVRDAADRALGEIREALATYEEHKTVANLRLLKAKIDNASSNITYTAKTLAEHAEIVVNRSKADIEAFIIASAHAAGIDPATVPAALEGPDHD